MKIVGSIEFGFFSPEQMRQMSAVKITIPDTYDEDGYPIAGGLADQRLGVIDPGLKCRTCGGRMKSCGGHFGHIELVRPVIHVGFAKMVYALLKSTCKKCSRLLNESSTIDKVKKTSECPHCGEKQTTIKFVKPTTFYEGDRRLLANEIRERLEHIPDEDLALLGVKIRPEWTILTVLTVPPVTVRPSITLETGERSEDDLTHKLVDIIRINQRLGENIDAGAPQLIIEDLWELLQYHTATFYDNETAGIPPARHRSGRQLKTLFQRLKGKEGRFRYNLSGKRVNFSARTVVTPDPTLGINALGVPEDIASELTVPLMATGWNIESCKQLIKDQSSKINYVIKPDGRRKKLTSTNIDEVVTELTEGYIIERQLMDGDTVIFNRQPSLHRVSMMAHKVKVLPGKTFRFNSADCSPYNADFDGDEMNIHVPQNEEAMAEAEILMKVSEQILSTRNGEPIIIPEYDHVAGAYVLTLLDWTFPKEEACRMLGGAGICEEVKKDLSGKELFSMILPDIDFKYERQKTQVVIKKGKLIEGVMDGKACRKLIKAIFLEKGSDAAEKFLNSLTMLTTSVLTQFGLSLSLDDYHLNQDALKQIEEVYREGHKQTNKLIKKYREKTLVRQPGKTLRETLEEQVMNILEKVRRDAWRVIKVELKKSKVTFSDKKEFEYNSAMIMADSGARGKPINVIQMAGLVGQQAIRGKRMKAGYKSRILTHYNKGNLTDKARGFVKNSYKSGLSPLEYFFHAAGGRDGVVDKGVNPAKTGYMQRRLINAMQDIIVAQDLSVRDAEGRVIQFTYGDDGKQVDGQKVAYGEPVGVIAAQSIGEPGTQMTLRTFHYAGVQSLAQLGFTRLVEIVDATKRPKSPVMEVPLKKEFSKDLDKVKKIAASIEQLTLEKVAEIKENFENKTIRIVFNEQTMKEHLLKEKEVIEKIKEIAPYTQTQTGITVKPKVESIKNVRKVTNKLKEIILKGIPGISRVIIIDKQGEFVLATEGSNLKDMLSHPDVDASKVTTNDIMETYQVLGIEAARNAIVGEIMKVLDAQDLTVDYRHIAVISDSMTNKGSIKSIGRHGLAGEKASVLARAAFEETAKHLLGACILGEEDLLRGIAENIIIGQTIPCGTGKVKLEMEMK